MTSERRLLAKVDRVQGNRRRPIGVKGRLEFSSQLFLSNSLLQLSLIYPTSIPFISAEHYS